LFEKDKALATALPENVNTSAGVRCIHKENVNTSAGVRCIHKFINHWTNSQKHLERERKRERTIQNIV